MCNFQQNNTMSSNMSGASAVLVLSHLESIFYLLTDKNKTAFRRSNFQGISM